MLTQIVNYIEDPSNAYAAHSVEYIRLCSSAIVLAIVIALPLSLLVARVPWLAFLATNISGLMRAIPILAFLAIAIPLLGTGFLPSLVALTILGIPPILLNTVAGLRSVDPAVTDAARGMGMTSLQMLKRIQLPLVLPVVTAGVRNAAVQIVATATLAGLIGGGGWGEDILTGIALYNNTQILVGGLSVALLAVVVEVALALLQRLVTPAGVRRTFQTIGPRLAQKRNVPLEAPEALPG